jgi:hypothetical protein
MDERIPKSFSVAIDLALPVGPVDSKIRETIKKLSTSCRFCAESALASREGRRGIRTPLSPVHPRILSTNYLLRKMWNSPGRNRRKGIRQLAASSHQFGASVHILVFLSLQNSKPSMSSQLINLYYFDTAAFPLHSYHPDRPKTGSPFSARLIRLWCRLCEFKWSDCSGKSLKQADNHD